MKLSYKIPALITLAIGLMAQPGLTITTALAGDGNVLPPTAKPGGYSLTDLAALTGAFNVGPRDGVSPTVDTPFVMLYVPVNGDTEFHVEPGTMLYVPVLYSYGDAVDVTDKAALADLYFSPDKYGAEYIEIVVDGKVTSVMRYGYPVGAVILLEGGGTLEYSTVAGVISPLTSGTHTVRIRALFDGAFLGGGIFEIQDNYTVIVE